MESLLPRIVENLIDRTTGPLHFRIFLQPGMAIAYAVYDGLKDAREGKPPYFWSLLTMPGKRAEMLRDGWKSVGKIFLLAVVLDAIYQWIVQRFVYPGELVIVAFVLAILPYILVRGVVTRLTPKRRGTAPG